jgi:mono/diheme cytochrome c family protein
VWFAPWRGEVTITLPPETAALKPGKGAELAQANCLMCHSTDYISAQPRMPRKFWEAEVKKMKEKFAAPLADENLAALADYLTATYGLAEQKTP